MFPSLVILISPAPDTNLYKYKYIYYFLRSPSEIRLFSQISSTEYIIEEKWNKLDNFIINRPEITLKTTPNS